MINENVSLPIENNQSNTTSDKKADQTIELNLQNTNIEYLKKISLTLESIDRNESFQSNLFFFDSVIILTLLVIYSIYSTLKRFL